jgi:cation:H+ antiporter
VAVAVFLVGAVVSLLASWLLVQRIERVGEWLGLSDGLVGLIAALAADGPEITSSVTALLDHEQSVGAGVVLGSNLFNLAALLGLAAVVAGVIHMHRRVVVFAGTISVVTAVLCLLAVTGRLPVGAALAGVLLALGVYAAALALDVRGLARLRLPASWCSWLCMAVGEEDVEVRAALPPAGGWTDVLVAGVCLVAVVIASVAMERSATALGARWHVADIVVGGIVLAAVTSLPNAVAAVYLARRGRGQAVLSTAINSNAINVAFGLLLPGVILGLGPVTGTSTLVATWYVALTVASLALIWLDGALRRPTGWAIIAAYAAFVFNLLAVTG